MKKVLPVLIISLGMVVGARISPPENSLQGLAYRALNDGHHKVGLRHISFLAANGNAKAQYNMGVFTEMELRLIRTI